MQSVVDEPVTRRDLSIEIRSRWSLAPTHTPEMQRLGLNVAEQCRLIDLEGAEALQPVHLAALIDPLAEVASVAGPGEDIDSPCVDVFCRPGVTDAEGEMATLALHHAGLDGVLCWAGIRYRLADPVSAEVRPAVERLLGNPLIHRFVWHEGAYGNPPLQRVASKIGSAAEPEWVETIELQGLGDDALLAISQRYALALDAAEMRTIAQYFHKLGRRPTDVELQSLALTWSEHCSHKTFKATIDFDCDGRREVIPGLIAAYLAAPTTALNRPWVRSAFVDNAGIIAFDEHRDLAFKVETHNHPSALEPFGGAHTGVGGVIRDILAVSAEPIANTDVLCFGPPDTPATSVPAGAFHPCTTYREVVRGVADYGNNMGIPTIGGAVLFHPGYTANPLVYCGTLGLAPRGSHPREPKPGDAIVVLGGRTGRDGLNGATMSSATLDRESVAGSTVQIGNPITEKTLRDVIPHLRDERLYHAITDCGAGGLCSAVGEMGETLGVDVDLALVPLKYEGLRPWEIWLSEAQERMVLAVPLDALPRLFELCHSYSVEATVLGRFRDDGALHLCYGPEIVGHLEMSFLHGGRPAQTLQARWTTPEPEPYQAADPDDARRDLLRLLAHPNIASKEEVIRRYDHEVGAATVVKPLVGNAGPSDAAILRPQPSSWRGAVISHGINPLYGAFDPHAMAMLAVDEALRNLVAVGGSIDHAALLDNFCWGDVDDPEELGRLVRAAQGCRDAALSYGVPFISGKDSLRNVSVDAEGRHSIPGTLLISAVGVVPNVRQTVTMDLKTPGSALYLLGLTSEELGGSHYQWLNGDSSGQIPRVRTETPQLMRTLTNAIRQGLVAACHDLSEGGLAVAAAEMSIAGGLGIDLDLAQIPADTDATTALLFGESAGRFLAEVPTERTDQFENLFADLPSRRIGATTPDAHLKIRQSSDLLVDIPITELEAAWKGHPRPPTTQIPPKPVAEGFSPVSTNNNLILPHKNRPKTFILAAPGVNCDTETVEACRLAGADVELVHLNQLMDGARSLLDAGFLVLPGGFSYGDHLGAGAMLATILRHRFMDDLQRFIDDGRPVLGICNGFQSLARLGLLGDVALLPNAHGKFECRWVPLRVEQSPCIFLGGLDQLELPIAHGQGRVAVPPDRLDDLLPLAPLRYCVNPNGSTADIAGVCNPAGNVFGLMPHPERSVTPYQHPGWSRDAHRQPAGLALFANAVRYVREGL